MKPARRAHITLQPLIAILTALLLFALPAAASAAFAAQPPEETLEAYLRAIFARDFATAYELIAQADRELKTKRDYLRENGAFSGAALDLTALLAEFIRFEYRSINIKGQDDATITFRAIVPDTHDPALRDLLLGFDQQSLKALSAGERAARGRQLRQLASANEMPLITGGEETWSLVRERGEWRVVLGWSAALDQQTLTPGEAKQFAVVFRPSYDTPDSITALHVRYEFFPLDAFPVEP